MSIEKIQKIINWVLEKNPNPDLTFLHGNNAYPTPLEDSCLLQIRKIIDTDFSHDITVGISDHTTSVVVPSLAVALGAKVVEKHFTISRYLTGPDHGPHALEPEELNIMVQNIRDAEKCLLEKSRMTDSEVKFVNAMRSVVTKRDILKGEILNEDSITTKRPFFEDCIPAEDFYSLIGKKILRNIKKDDILKKQDIL